MFNRKKPGQRAQAVAAPPRGRAADGASPLARRFLEHAEPDTVDLAEPGRFHAPAEDRPVEPDTRATGAAAAAAGRQPVVSRDARTGKLYLHPGSEACPVRLNGAVVDAPTELRPGDRLGIGDRELDFPDPSAA